MFNINKIVDLKLLLIVLALVACGLMIISSATGLTALGQMNDEVLKQSISFVLGFFMMVALMIIDYRFWGRIYLLVYIISVAVLLLVYIPGLGVEHFGARSWIKLRFMQFQPSEIAKIGFIISFAKILERRKGKLNSPLDLFLPVLSLAPILYLLRAQPDYGTMLVFIFIFLGMIFVAGINLKIVALSLITFIVTVPIIYNTLDGHARDRIEAFFSQSSNQGYSHVLMSKLTIGSGGLTGSGLFNGSFSSNNFLPVQDSDFIFAVWVEELGFIGGIALIGLFLLLFTRLIYIAFMSVDEFGTNIVIGVLFMFGFHVFQNIGMTMGIMPVTGVPLPFISYGGSSLLANMISIGIVMSVYLRKPEKEEDDIIVRKI